MTPQVNREGPVCTAAIPIGIRSHRPLACPVPGRCGYCHCTPACSRLSLASPRRPTQTHLTRFGRTPAWAKGAPSQRYVRAGAGQKTAGEKQSRPQIPNSLTLPSKQSRGGDPYRFQDLPYCTLALLKHASLAGAASGPTAWTIQPVSPSARKARLPSNLLGVGRVFAGVASGIELCLIELCLLRVRSGNELDARRFRLLHA